MLHTRLVLAMIAISCALVSATHNYSRPIIDGDLTCERGTNRGCPPSWCCSPGGFCGTSDDHCRDTTPYPPYSDEEGPLVFDATADPNYPNLEPLDRRQVLHGYYFRATAENVPPRSVPADLLTHLIYAFARVNFDYDLYSDFDDDETPETGFYATMIRELRANNPDIVVMISVGGATQNEEGVDTQPVFTNMVATRENRRTFINNAIAYARRHGFGGLDLDWEFPGDPLLGGRPEDKDNLVLLMREWHDAVVEEAARTGQTRLLLTMALIPSYALIGYGYHLEQLHNHFDWINLMTYELHFAVDTVTGPHTGLYDNPQGDIEESLYLFNMVPGFKVAIGVANFAKAFNLAPGARCAYGQPATGFAPEIRYSEIVQLFAENPDIVLYQDEITQTSYFCHENILYSYSSAEDIVTAMEYINGLGLRGAFSWTLDQDDAAGGFPLTRAMSTHLSLHEDFIATEGTTVGGEGGQTSPSSNGAIDEETGDGSGASTITAIICIVAACFSGMLF